MSPSKWVMSSAIKISVASKIFHNTVAKPIDKF